jgi:hypothetical protein
MEVDNELVDHNDDEEEVYDPKDLQMLGQLGIKHEENLEPSDYLHYLDNFDSDDERIDIPANPTMIQTTFNTCNTMFFRNCVFIIVMHVSLLLCMSY